jgi:RimJ/RimL family protein N-acetyltransferase
MTPTNEYGQAVGDLVPDWAPAVFPEALAVPGTYCTLEHLDPDRHVADLYAAYAAAPDSRDWTYLPVGPFPTAKSYREWATAAANSRDPRHFAVVDNATGCALGTLALMRHDPANGVIEVGFVVWSRELQGTRISTEAQFLLMRYAFELGYRRYEWKCDSLNEPSRRAAERLGFTYEGTFRQAVVYKGRNRDTAWFAMTDVDWPAVREAFEKWLDPANFDRNGRQLEPLRTAVDVPTTDADVVEFRFKV